ncbi:hypothetical protein BN946_scf184873.g17 [Trametes cinnabarina]|uniref:Uncharacterized protein n=1 Tax=Pycnoporus cinnabarinus TaxID=5643 RepID=A0A060STZ7_PYCCI|nr:hypothetical protein BN946_scf184873.g17 [Trametes cinnabarina]
MPSFSSLTIAIALATSIMAHPPTIVSRASPVPGCDGLGVGVFNSASRFKLGAVNTTLANANITGAPLVVNSAGATNSATFWHLGTWAQYPDPLEYTSISLANGTLVIEGDGAPPAQAAPVDAGNSLEWFSSSTADPAEGAQIYCGVPPPGNAGSPVLAVNGDTDSFSLCQSSFENVVYYKAQPDHGYDFDSCYPVKLVFTFF